MSDGQPSMTRLIVSGNEAVYGGGLCLLSSQATLEDLVIVDNWAFYGGGVYLADAEATFERVVINQNYSGDDDDGAGGAYFLSSVATLTNVVVTDNQSSGVAGGIELDDSSATLTNVDVSGNTSDWAGGIYSHSSSVTLSNVDIVDNWGWGHGGGVWGYFTISHSNLNGNYPDDVYGMADPIGTNGNISADPDLYDSLGHLNTTSPLVDAGDPAILDPDGSPSDIGAFGGPGADDWDLDGDGYFSWWLPGAYDPATSPGMDCNDEDATVYPGAGC